MSMAGASHFTSVDSQLESHFTKPLPDMNITSHTSLVSRRA